MERVRRLTQLIMKLRLRLLLSKKSQLRNNKSLRLYLALLREKKAFKKLKKLKMSYKSNKLKLNKSNRAFNKYLQHKM